MIETVRAIGNTKTMGTLAVMTRIKLLDSVIMPSILYNVEVMANLTKKEMRDLEQMQGEILTRLLEVPRSTPYMGLLMETGVWTMEARITYKKLMLYHNIINSDEERIIKKIVKIQEEEEREGTWYQSTKKKMKKYEIEKDVEKVLKSEWKREVKKKIGKKVEEEVRERCKIMKKTRTIKDDEYKTKNYLQETVMSEATDILRTRLHMAKLKCNYESSKNSACPLCGEQNDIKTEHYFGECKMTSHLAKIWNTTEEDMRSTEGEELRRAKNHIKKVEMMMEAKMAV